MKKPMGRFCLKTVKYNKNIRGFPGSCSSGGGNSGNGGSCSGGGVNQPGGNGQ